MRFDGQTTTAERYPIKKKKKDEVYHVWDDFARNADKNLIVYDRSRGKARREKILYSNGVVIDNPYTH